MKIVSWNCNGALRNKFEKILALDADIYVIQECESPAETKKPSYREWAENSLWVGTKHKGIGIFSKRHKLKALDWKSGKLELFLPFTIDDAYTVLAVWTKYANSPNFRYIGQMWKYLKEHAEKIPASKTIICGDFNSNTCWDEWDRWWNHSDVVRDLAKMGIHSAYHHQTGEAQGKEIAKTFYLHRKIEKHYHIDYFFVSEDLLGSGQLSIGSASDWLGISDHMPITLDFRSISN